jgi:hypothetical protein
VSGPDAFILAYTVERGATVSTDESCGREAGVTEWIDTHRSASVLLLLVTRDAVTVEVVREALDTYPARTPRV